MAEPRDDKVSAAFRALPPLEPPAALDDAIRAAARRAVAAKPVPSTRRWAIPASIAAVLALSVGIALQVEREKPLVVDGTPVPSGSAEYPVPQAPAEPPPKVEAPKTEPLAKADAPKAEPVSKDAPPGSRTPDPGMLREEARAALPAPALQRMAPPTPAAPASATADSARASSSEMAPAVQSAAPIRAKREAAGASVAKEIAMPSPEKALERIAELRAAGRHAEADEALAKFRRDYPDLRITPETWEKVRGR